MCLQGLPAAAAADVAENTPNHVMADLAGIMVGVPVMMALLMAAAACVDWRAAVDTVGGADDDSGINAAALAFMLLACGGHASGQL